MISVIALLLFLINIILLFMREFMFVIEGISLFSLFILIYLFMIEGLDFEILIKCFNVSEDQ